MQQAQLKPKREMLNYINVFRGLAILLIVAGHTMQFGNPKTWVNNAAFEVFTGGTVLFIFISGFLFQYLSDKYEYEFYLKKKWTNVILPYIITAIPGIILCFTMPAEYGNPFEGLNPFAQIGIFLTTGRVHNVPTWYIPMIVIFFLLADVFIVLERKKILYKLLPLLLLVTIIIPRTAIEPEYLTGMTYGAKYLAYINYVLNGFVHFASMYVLGMYFCANRYKIELCYKYRLSLIFLMLLTSTIDIILLHKYGITNGTISKTFLTLVLLGYLKHYDEKIKNCQWFNKSADFVAKYSFSIFFIHWYLVFGYNKLFNIPKVLGVNTNMEFFKALLLVSLRYMFVVGMSLLIISVLKRFLVRLRVENTRAIIGA